MEAVEQSSKYTVFGLRTLQGRPDAQLDSINLHTQFYTFLVCKPTIITTTNCERKYLYLASRHSFSSVFTNLLTHYSFRVLML